MEDMHIDVREYGVKSKICMIHSNLYNSNASDLMQ